VLNSHDPEAALLLARRQPYERRYGEAAAFLVAGNRGVPAAERLAVLTRARANDPWSPRLDYLSVVAYLDLGDRPAAEAMLDRMRRTAPNWQQTGMAAALLEAPQ